jgi:hypothetical protein
MPIRVWRFADEIRETARTTDEVLSLAGDVPAELRSDAETRLSQSLG